jgi:presqualene diphosphate synthase
MTAKTALPQPTAAPRASGSSFYAAMRLLPPGQREAMFEIYAFCRAVDDIADGNGPRELRLDQLQQWRNEIDALYADNPPPHLRNIACAVENFDLAREDFIAVIDGMEMDVTSTIRAPDLATLDLYCDRVASGVGRLSVRIFGMERESGHALAHHLGRALQLTNILRDLDEDAAMGRLYIPREALNTAGITSSDPAEVLSDQRLAVACAAVVAGAQHHFAASEAIMACSPSHVIRTPRLMTATYRNLLDRLVARGWDAPRTRVRLSRWQLVWILLRNVAFR